jgi:transposase
MYQRFLYWKNNGIWQKMFEFMQDLDPQEFMIDGTIIRANQCSAGYKKGGNEDEGLGRSCGGFSTKIHAMVDALGNSAKLIITPGNYHDVTQAEELTCDLENTRVLADKGYDSQRFVDFLNQRRCDAVVPSRENTKNPREIDKDIYKERHLVENFFSKIKWYRRVFFHAFARRNRHICHFYHSLANDFAQLKIFPNEPYTENLGSNVNPRFNIASIHTTY